MVQLVFSANSAPVRQCRSDRGVSMSTDLSSRLRRSPTTACPAARQGSRAARTGESTTNSREPGRGLARSPAVYRLAVLAMSVNLTGCGAAAARPASHPGVEVPLEGAGVMGTGPGVACSSKPMLVTTPRDLDKALCKAKANGKTSCTPSRGIRSIDWRKQSIFLFPHPSDEGVWKIYANKGRIDVVVLTYCQGIAPVPECQSFVVPRAKAVDIEISPRGPCSDVP